MTLREEDVVVSNVKIDLTRGRNNPLERCMLMEALLTELNFFPNISQHVWLVMFSCDYINYWLFFVLWMFSLFQHHVLRGILSTFPISSATSFETFQISLIFCKYQQLYRIFRIIRAKRNSPYLIVESAICFQHITKTWLCGCTPKSLNWYLDSLFKTLATKHFRIFLLSQLNTCCIM